MSGRFFENLDRLGSNAAKPQKLKDDNTELRRQIAARDEQIAEKDSQIKDWENKYRIATEDAHGVYLNVLVQQHELRHLGSVASMIANWESAINPAMFASELKELKIRLVQVSELGSLNAIVKKFPRTHIGVEARLDEIHTIMQDMLRKGNFPVTSDEVFAAVEAQCSPTDLPTSQTPDYSTSLFTSVYSAVAHHMAQANNYDERTGELVSGRPLSPEKGLSPPRIRIHQMRTPPNMTQKDTHSQQDPLSQQPGERSNTAQRPQPHPLNTHPAPETQMSLGTRSASTVSTTTQGVPAKRSGTADPNTRPPKKFAGEKAKRPTVSQTLSKSDTSAFAVPTAPKNVASKSKVNTTPLQTPSAMQDISHKRPTPTLGQNALPPSIDSHAFTATGPNVSSFQPFLSANTSFGSDNLPIPSTPPFNNFCRVNRYSNFSSGGSPVLHGRFGGYRQVFSSSLTPPVRMQPSGSDCEVSIMPAPHQETPKPAEKPEDD